MLKMLFVETYGWPLFRNTRILGSVGSVNWGGCESRCVKRNVSLWYPVQAFPHRIDYYRRCRPEADVQQLMFSG